MLPPIGTQVQEGELLPSLKEIALSDNEDEISSESSSDSEDEVGNAF